MKKTFIKTLLLVLVMVMPCAFIFSACKKDEEPTPPPVLKQEIEYLGAKYEGVPSDENSSVGEYIFTGVSSSTEFNKLVIPDAIDGFPVTEIASEAFESSTERPIKVKEIVVGNNVKKIGAYAFGSNPYIEKVTLGNNVKELGRELFAGSHNITEVKVSAQNQTFKAENNAIITKADNILVAGSIACTTIPSGVVEIAENAFYRVLSDFDNKVTLTIPNTVTKIGAFAFYRCIGINQIVFEENSTLTTIDEGAFFMNTGVGYDPEKAPLTTLTLPNSVTTIGKRAFANNINLKSIDLGSSINIIKERAFMGCTVLDTISYNGNKTSSSLLTIEDSAFVKCSALDYIYIKNTTTAISPSNGKDGKGFVVCDDLCYDYRAADGGFYICCGIVPGSTATSLTVYSKLGSIDVQSFTEIPNLVTSPDALSHPLSKNKSLEVFTIQGGVKMIDTIADSTVKTVYLGNGVDTLPASAFQNCTSLTKVNLAAATSLQSISNYAFFGCSALTTITLPDSVTSIRDAAFKNTALTSIDLNKVTTIGNGAFASISNFTLTITDKVTLQKNPGCPVAYNDLLYKYATADDTFYCAGFSGSPLSDVIVPSKVGGINVSSISYSNFAGTKDSPNTTLKTLKVSDGVNIFGSAFAYCQTLTTVELGNGVTTLPNNIFLECKALTSITLPVGTITSIGNGAFKNSGITEINLTNNLLTIGNNAFQGAPITSLILPRTLTTIGSAAFSYMGVLESIYIPSSVTTIMSPEVIDDTTKGQLPFFMAGWQVKPTAYTTKIYVGKTFAEATYPSTWLNYTTDKAYANVEYGVSNPNATHNVDTTITYYEIVGDKAYSYNLCSCGAKTNYTLIDNAIIATPENVQSILDSNINGKTIVFVGTFEEDLIFQTTRASNSIIMPNIGTNKDENAVGLYDYDSLLPNGIYSYQREISNVRFVAVNNTTFAGRFLFDARWYGDTSYDPIKQESTGHGHTQVLFLENIEFYNLTFTGPGARIYMSITNEQSEAHNIRVANCSFTTTTVNASNNSAGAALYLTTANLDKIENVAFINNFVSGHTMGIYVANANNVMVTGNEIKNTVHNAIGIQCGNGQYTTGSILIENNILSQDKALEECATDRAIRFSTMNNATVTIRNNTITNFMNSVDNKNEIIKTGNFNGTSTLTQENNKYFTAEGVESDIVIYQVEGTLYYLATNENDIYFKQETKVNGLTAAAIEGKNEYAITGFVNTPVADLVIPDTIDGFPVTEITSQSFFGNETIEKIIIGKNVTTIGSEAFSEIPNLKEIVLGENVEELGIEAFSHNPGLTKISVDENNAIFYTTEKNDALVTKADNVLVLGTSICTTIPEGITAIGDRAFYGSFRYLDDTVTIKIPSSVTTIGEYAFYRATSIAEIDFSEASGLVTIKKGAFAFMRTEGNTEPQDANLKSIVFPAGLTTIEEDAFANFESIENISFATEANKDIVLTIGAKAFAHTGLTSMDFGARTIDIGRQAFYATKFTELVLENNVVSFGNNAFADIDTLTKITIRENVTHISGSYLFQNSVNENRKVTTIDLTGATDLTTIGDSAFSSIVTVTTVDFGTITNLTSIGNYAFAHNSITNFYIPTSITTLGYGVCYQNTTLKTIYVGQESIPATYAENWNALSGNQNIAYETGFTYDAYKVATAEVNGVSFKLIKGTDGRDYEYVATGLADDTITKVIIPDTINGYKVTKIAANAFNNCDYITSVTMGANVETIEDKAFYSCNLLSTVKLNNGLMSIGSHVFSYCVLESLWIPKTVTSMAANIVYYNLSLKTIYVEENEYAQFTEGWNALSNNASYAVETGFSYEASLVANITHFGLKYSLVKSEVAGRDYEYILTGSEAGLTDIEVPSSINGYPVTQIASTAFYDGKGTTTYKTLVSVKLNSGLEKIHKGAFIYCKFQHIWIPKSVIFMQGKVDLTNKAIIDGLTPVFYQVANMLKSAIYVEATAEELAAMPGIDPQWNAVSTNQLHNVKYGYTYAEYLADLHIKGETAYVIEAVDSTTNAVYSYTTCSCGEIHEDTKVLVENAIIVTPENVQSVLDSNINGKVIVFDGIFTEELYFRPTAASNSEIIVDPTVDSEVSTETLESVISKTNTSYHYRRTFENISFVATEGTTIAGRFKFYSAWHGNNTYDPMKGYVAPVGHTEVLILNNITFSGLNFVGSEGRIYIYGHTGKSTNLTVNNCSFVTDTITASNNTDGAAVMFTTASAGVAINTTFTNNYVDGHTMGLYISNADTVTANNNTIKNTTHNGIGIYQTNGRATTGTILVQNNNISFCKDKITDANATRETYEAEGNRAIRLGHCKNATITISNNKFDYTYYQVIISGSTEGWFTGCSYQVYDNYYNGTLLAEATGTDEMIYITIPGYEE